jgi:alcohol dehydrogenase class IV
MKQKEYFGKNSINNLSEIIRYTGTKKVFLITGKSSYKSSGAKKKIEENLKDLIFTRFSSFSSNPRLEEINKGFELFKRESYDLIIAIGGGSSIDIAKAIKLFYWQEFSKNIPLIAIPTTAGTGSEATYFIVYYIGNKKQSVGKLDLTLPEYSIIDPQFVYSLPKEVLASTGIDALAQAIESYWSINSTEKSKKFAAEAIRIIMENLEKAYDNSKESIDQMMRASNLAGKAINITRTTACHSISYPITSNFKVPHGHAAGLTLGEMLVYNYGIGKDCNDPRGPEYVKQTIKELSLFLGAKTPRESKEIIKNLMISIGLEVNLLSLGISEEGIKLIVKESFAPERVKNNPRILTKENLKVILDNLTK